METENSLQENITEDAEDIENEEGTEFSSYVKFSKPYQFEDDTYTGIDMSGMEDLTAKDLGEIEKKFYRANIPSFNPENTVTYAKLVVQKVTGMPIEFFDQLPVKEMMKIKSRVVNFFYA